MTRIFREMQRSPVNIGKKHRQLRCGLLAGALLLQFLLPDCGFALDPARNVLEYNCQTWSRQNGLPANGINAIAQTKDGYLWLGTTVGLVRFDGIEFKLLDLTGTPQVRNGNVTSLASAKDGGLWIGLENNAFGFYDGQSFSFRGKDAYGKVNMNVRTILEGKDGTVWLAAERMAARLTRSGNYEEVLGSSTNYTVNILCGYEDPKGRLWFGTANAGVYYWQAGKITKLPDPTLDGSPVYCVAEDLKGQIWIGTGTGLFCYNSNLEKKEIPPLPWEIRALLVDRHGVLWIGTTGHGLVRYQDGQYSSLLKTDGLTSDFIKSLAEDREGSLWIGTRDGLSQLTDVKFPTHPAAEDPTVKDALAVSASRKGGVWVGSSAGLTYFDGKPKTYGLESGLTNLFIKRVFEASDGDVYAVSGNSTLAVFSGRKVVATYPATNMVVGLAEDAHGVVASVGGYLYRVGTNYFTPYIFTNGEPSFGWILNLTTDREGAILVACATGIFRVKDGTFQQWLPEAPASTIVQWVCEDSDGVVWGAQLTGIVRLKDNQLRYISRKDGLFDNNIFSIVPDDFGNLWVDSGRGIFRVSRKSMNDFADGKTNRVECVAYDGPESVKPSDKSNQEHIACKTPDGRIWFPSANGLVEIDPAHIPINHIVPPVHIDSVRANGIELDRDKNMIVPPGHGELEIHFTALSFIAPQKERFRYQLEGYDKDWVEAGDRREAFYTNLKPGRYAFRVIAANADGVWNETGDTLKIELRPYYYQTLWFRLLCGGLALAALIGIYLQRVRRLEFKQQTLQKNRDLLEAEVLNRTAELSHERDLLRALLDNSPDHIYFKDAQSRFIASSKAQAAQFGVASPDELVGKSDFDFFTEEHARPAFEDEQEIIRTGQPVIGKVEKEAWKDGRGESWVLTTKMPLRNKNGEIIGTFGISKDITSIKKAESMLRESEERFSGAFEYAPIGVALVSPDGHWLKVNRAVCNLVGYSEAELLARTFQDITHPDDLAANLENVRRLLAGEISSYQMEKRYVHARGHSVTVLLSVSLVRDGRGLPLYFIAQIQDITERKRLEAHLFQSQKMETVGKLAGGVAHEFNSIMTAIIGQSELLLGDLPPGNPLGKNASEIRKAAGRAAILTRQLLAYGRKQILQPEILDLNAVIAGMDNMLSNLMGRDVEVRFDPAAGLKSVKADAGQIEQVVINIAMNAADAMPNGGKLMLETANVALDADYAGRFPELKAGEYVMLAIADTGAGMSEETKSRLFEPFFTTKDVGKGTGLGLATCHGIIKQSGGHIAIYSELGRGTTVKIYLPQIEPEIKLPAQPKTPPDFPRGTETILLVEDDPSLREMAATLLRRLGYTVLTAANGVEAMGLVHKPGTGHIDLLFTDVVMPQMSGNELADRIRALHPQTKILFTTAYTESAAIHQGVLTKGVALLQKPFTPSALANKVREMLDMETA